MLKPDAYVNIKFYETANGGRKSATPFQDSFGFVFRVDNKNFDCRILFSERCSICPGDSKDNIPIKFLDYEGVKNELCKNRKFYMWEGGIIGEGTILDFVK
jgi:hypothetical protein